MREDIVAQHARSFREAVAFNRLQLESVREAFRIRDAFPQSPFERLAREMREQTEQLRRLSGYSITKQLEDAMRGYQQALSAQQSLGNPYASEMAKLMADLKPLSTFGSTHWSQLSRSIFADVERQRAFFDQLTQSLQHAHPGLERGVAEDIASAVSEPDAQPDTASELAAESIEDVVARAVAAAVAKEGRRVDWRFVIGIMLTVLMFLYDQFQASETESRLAADHDRVEARVLALSAKFDLLLTREVLRETPLRSRPSRNASKQLTIPGGTLVVVEAYRGKWARVRLVMTPSSNASTAPQLGWMLKKYLSPAL